jgi:hypothetical protein
MPSAMQVFDSEAARWAKFRRALRREDQDTLDELFIEARRQVAAISYIANPIPMEAILLAMLLGERRSLKALRDKVHKLDNALGKSTLTSVGPGPSSPLKGEEGD